MAVIRDKRPGRKPKHGVAMSPAERQRERRARLKAELPAAPLPTIPARPSQPSLKELQHIVEDAEERRRLARIKADEAEANERVRLMREAMSQGRGGRP